jgi:hypothetical protein
MIEKTFYPLPTIVVRYNGSKEVNYIVDFYICWLRWTKVFTLKQRNNNKESLPF